MGRPSRQMACHSDDNLTSYDLNYKAKKGITKQEPKTPDLNRNSGDTSVAGKIK